MKLRGWFGPSATATSWSCKREPDPASQTFVDKVLRDHWSQDDVERELKKSAEYRNKH